MTATRLLLPHELRTRRVVTETARAFRFGPRLHPNRAAYEFYPTPPEATRALLSAERFDGSIWEPACETGWISRELIAAGYEVVSTDLVDYGYGEPGRDFLAERKPRAKHIVTNPPYGRGLADAFVKHALELTTETGGTVAMLVNLLSLCHPLRHDFYVGHPPAVILRPRRVYLLALRRSVAGHHEHRQATLLLAGVETWAPRPYRVPVAEYRQVSGSLEVKFIYTYNKMSSI
jgi:hypothetical protein